MNIGKFSVKNRYIILPICIVIILFGIYAKLTMKVQLAPDTTPPMATVITQYPGASAQDVATDVIEPMEEEFGRLDGISKIKSTSQDNVAIVQLEFDYGINIDDAAIDVQNSLGMIKDKLPPNIKEPKVLKFSTSDKPIMTISLKSDSMNMHDVRQLAEEKISYDLQMVKGVASIDIFGGYNNEVQVKIDKNKLNSYGLSLNQVSAIIVQNNIKSPGGIIQDNNKDILIRIEENFKSIDNIKKLNIPLKDGNSIYLQDIADVSLSIKKLESSYRVNGEEGIALLITKKSDENTIEVIERIKKQIDKLKTEYPLVNFEIAQDDSIFTLQMVDNMTSGILSSILLTTILIMLFISKIGQSVVVSMSMPLVFLLTLGLMKMSNMKLDLVTLSALILSIGFVVDATIVVVENIMRHYTELKKDIISAAIDGVQEIVLPSLAGATTTLIVLIPLVFLKGYVGQMFRPLALTVIYAISASVLIALIIIPLFTALINKYNFNRVEKVIEIVTVPFNKAMISLQDFYVKIFKIALGKKLITYIIMIALMGSSGILLARKGVEMLPKFDSGVTFISIEMEPGTKLEDTSKIVKLVEDFLAKEKNIINYSSQIGYEKGSNQLGDFGIMGTNQAIITVNLKTRNERKETIWQFQEKVRDYIDDIPDIKRFVVKEQGGTAVGGSSAPIDIRISGQDQELLYDLALKLEEKVKGVPGTINVYKSFNLDNLQVNIKMNSSRIEELGLTNSAISKQIYSSIEGIVSTNMDFDEAENVDINVGYMDKYKKSIDDLLDVYIENPMGLKIPLRELASIDIKKRANIVTREDFEYTIDILGYTEGRAYSHIIKDLKGVTDEYKLPDGYRIEFTGDQASLGGSMKDMVFLLALSIIFVYLLLVPQFKSFIHPITIMISIPLVVIGVAPALIISNKYISMPVLLGFILLAGTVVNNAILLIEFAIVKQEEGLSIENAVIAAIKSRFRPIMMTALSDVTGMLPLALQLALGSERFSPLAITVIGGILAATLLTLVIIPLVFITFEKIKTPLRRSIDA